LIEGVLSGLRTVLQPLNLVMVLLGCGAGTFIGMLPGLGPITAIALMIPITYGLDPAAGLILMAGVYYGAVFGGSTSSILLNAPGVAGTVATAFDGFPLARRGFAGKALAVAAYASFSGGTLAAVLLLVAAPALASVALGFHSPDYFAVGVLALVSVSAFAGEGRPARAAMMVIFGLMLATVGQDVASDVPRFTFGTLALLDGISFLLLAMAVFALSEALLGVLRPAAAEHTRPRISELSSLRLERAEVREIAAPITRSSLLGFFVGVLPGAGATIASFLAYASERYLAPPRARELFGKGSLRGLAAPEAANNAACSGSFVPLLTLGIPGSGTTAVMLGALLSAGVQPGPRLLTDRPDVFWSVILSMYLGNLVLLVLNLPFIPWLARLLLVPRPILLPLVIFFSVMGVYAVTLSPFDIVLMVVLALGATWLRLMRYPLPPLVLAFVLGPMLEENLRRSLILYDGSPAFLWQRPTTLVLLLVGAAILAGRGWQRRRVVTAGSNAGS
jgi:putative tricarboxylic transport membrane protein